MVTPISKSLIVTAETLKKTLNKHTVIVLSLDDEGYMHMGWTGHKVVNLLGMLTWAITAIGQDLDNEQEAE